MIRNYFAINICFSNCTGNKLRVLATKIENENLFGHGAKVSLRKITVKRIKN